MNHSHPGLLSWRELRPFVVRCGVALLDAAAVLAGYALAYAVRFHWAPFLDLFPATKGVPAPIIYVAASPVVFAAWWIGLSVARAYRRINLSALDELFRVAQGGLAGTFLAMSALFLYRDSSYSRLVFLLGGAASAAFIYGERQLFKIAAGRWSRGRRRVRRVLIVGHGRLAQTLERILGRERNRAVLRVSAFNSKAIQRTIGRSRIDEILLADPHADHREAVAIANFCEDRGIECRLLPDVLEIRMGEVLIDDSLGVPTIRIRPVSLHGSSFLLKRMMDIVLAGTALLVLSVPLFIVAVLIRATSRGPVLFRQQRLGFRSRPFNFLKFRTMVQNADDLLAELKAKSDRGGPVFKMKKDPRVTTIGQFLRRYSIDELPQLLNVLKGDMSLVGPRPQVLWEAEGYDEWARKRLNVLPGITGLWQVSGRAELTFEEMIELDVYYIEHWSPGLDLKIILKTIPAVLLGKGAY